METVIVVLIGVTAAGYLLWQGYKSLGRSSGCASGNCAGCSGGCKAPAVMKGK